MNVTERLLMGESAFVPGALDPVIWNALTTNEKFVLQDYWKRYVNVPGSPELTHQAHSLVIDKVLTLITGYNNHITWPKIQALTLALQAIPDLVILDRNPIHSAQ